MLAPLQQPRGLQNFISDIRNSNSREQEQKRVDKELANIRQNFANFSALKSYDKKKYVWKLVYIFMLGYEVDFGHMEVISLISSSRYQEKNVGYIATSLLLKAGDEMMTMVINSIRNDLNSPNHAFQTIALSTIANIGGIDFAESVGGDIQRLLITSSTMPAVKKKAALCLLRLFRTHPDCISHDELSERMISMLGNSHLGVVTAITSLLIGVANQSPDSYDFVVPFVIDLLSRLVLKEGCRQEYHYYRTPSPWLQVKLLKFLQLYPIPKEDKHTQTLNDTLRKILTKTEVSDSQNKSNADHSVLFEAVNLILHYGTDSESVLRTESMNLLGRFISVKEPNIRYLGLETLSKLARLEGNEGIKEHEKTVMISMKDADVSVRKRALDLLFVMCDRSNAEEIVSELVTYLATTDVSLKEEMVLKIAILAEKFANDLNWYLDTMIQIITIAGDYVSDDIWFRIVQIITNNKDLQQYAAEKLFRALESAHAHEALVLAGDYVLGEFGYLIAEEPEMAVDRQYQVLNQHFPNASIRIQCLLLSTYAKFANLYPECVETMIPILEKHASSVETELQQRAIEYLKLLKSPEELTEAVLREMPSFPEDRESALERRLRENEEGDGEQSTTPRNRRSLTQEDDEAEEEREPVVENLILEYDEEESEEQEEMETRGIPPSLIPNLRAWFNNLVITSQNVLFEDPYLQIGVKHEYRAHQGQIAIFYRNMGTAPLTSFSVEIREVPFLRYQKRGLNETEIQPGSQANQVLMVECMQPFSDVPEIRVGFVCDGCKFSYPLRLPVVATCFMEPITLEASDFLTRWEKLSGETRECKEVFNVKTSIDAVRMEKIKSIIRDGMHMGLSVGLDGGSPFRCSAAATFRTGSKSPQGANISIGCMLVLDYDDSGRTFTLTCRAVHGKISLALKNILRVQLVL